MFENADSKSKVDRNSPVMVMDSILKIADSVVYKGTSGGALKYSIYDSNSIITRTDLYVDPGTRLISKILYQYAPSDSENEYGVDRVMILYLNIKDKVSDPSVLNESRIIQRLKKKVWLSEKYKGYTLFQHQNIHL
jgi:hypothetical protein